MRRLARVREWKERLEREARARRLDAEARATALDREAEGCRAERRGFPDAAASGADVAELAAWARRAELLVRRERGARARRDAMRDEIEATQAAHVALRQDVESLRRLEERRARREERRRERKRQETTDDAAARRFLPGVGKGFPVEMPLAGEGRGAGRDERSTGAPFSRSEA